MRFHVTERTGRPARTQGTILCRAGPEGTRSMLRAKGFIPPPKAPCPGTRRRPVAVIALSIITGSRTCRSSKLRALETDEASDRVPRNGGGSLPRKGVPSRARGKGADLGVKRYVLRWAT